MKTKILSLCFVFLFLSCQTDNVIVNSTSSSNSIERIPMTKILGDEKIRERVDAFFHSDQKLARRVNLDSLGNYYDDAEVLKISYLNYTTYTFALLQDKVSENTQIQNFVIVDHNHEINSYVLTYMLDRGSQNDLLLGKPIHNLGSKVKFDQFAARNGSAIIYIDNDGNCWVYTGYDPTYDPNNVNVGWNPAGCPPDRTGLPSKEEFMALINSDPDDGDGGPTAHYTPGVWLSVINLFSFTPITYNPGPQHTGIENWPYTGDFLGHGGYPALEHIITIPLLPIRHVSDEFMDSLEADNLTSWWINPQNSLKKDEIYNFIHAPGGSEAFALEMVKALNEGYDVDIAHGWVFRMNNVPWEQSVIKDVLSKSSSFLDFMNSAIGQNQKKGVVFTNSFIAATGGTLVTSHTEPQPFPNPVYPDFYININFNDVFLASATNYGIAATLLHELSHAYFIYNFFQGNYQNDITFEALQNSFLAFYTATGTFDAANDEIHNAMDQLMSSLIASLIVYSQSDIHPLTFLQSTNLMWGTMQETDLFTLMLNSTQQNAAINSYNDEWYHTPNAKGHRN